MICYVTIFTHTVNNSHVLITGDPLEILDRLSLFFILCRVGRATKFFSLTFYVRSSCTFTRSHIRRTLRILSFVSHQQYTILFPISPRGRETERFYRSHSPKTLSPCLPTYTEDQTRQLVPDLSSRTCIRLSDEFNPSVDREKERKGEKESKRERETERETTWCTGPGKVVAFNRSRKIRASVLRTYRGRWVCRWRRRRRQWCCC